MFIKSFIFLFGFGLCIISISFIIIYLNLFTIGYSFIDYINFISRRIECINIFVGLFLIYLSYLYGGKDELYI